MAERARRHTVAEFDTFQSEVSFSRSSVFAKSSPRFALHFAKVIHLRNKYFRYHRRQSAAEKFTASDENRILS